MGKGLLQIICHVENKKCYWTVSNNGKCGFSGTNQKRDKEY